MGGVGGWEGCSIKNLFYLFHGPIRILMSVSIIALSAEVEKFHLKPPPGVSRGGCNLVCSVPKHNNRRVRSGLRAPPLPHTGRPLPLPLPLPQGTALLRGRLHATAAVRSSPPGRSVFTYSFAPPCFRFRKPPSERQRRFQGGIPKAIPVIQ